MTALLQRLLQHAAQNLAGTPADIRSAELAILERFGALRVPVCEALFHGGERCCGQPERMATNKSQIQVRGDKDLLPVGRQIEIPQMQNSL